MPPTMRLQPYCPLRPLLVSCTLLHSTPECLCPLNATTMSTIKRYLRLLKPSHIGDTISRGPVHQSTSSPTTRTFSTFPLPRSSHVDKQAHWSEFLSAFNLVICFHPGKLGTKPDALTRWWDIYPKEGNSNYATVNPQNY